MINSNVAFVMKTIWAYRNNCSLKKQHSKLLNCEHCNEALNFTPQMRRGPSGYNTLCNRCGLKYARVIKQSVKNNNNRFNWGSTCTTNNTNSEKNTRSNKLSTNEKDYIFTPTSNTENTYNKITSSIFLKIPCCDNTKNNNNVWNSEGSFFCEKCKKEICGMCFVLYHWHREY